MDLKFELAAAFWLSAPVARRWAKRQTFDSTPSVRMQMTSRSHARVMAVGNPESWNVEPQTGIESVLFTLFHDQCVSSPNSIGVSVGNISWVVELRLSRGRMRMFMSSTVPGVLTRWVY